MNRPYVLMESTHFLYPKLDQNTVSWLDPEDEELHSDIIPELKKGSVLFDFSQASSDEKRSLYEQLEEQGINVYADLSAVWGEAFMQEFRCLKGGMATGIESPNNTYEACVPREQDRGPLNKIFESMGLTPHWVSTAGLGFTFPRVLAQIVNEAYFSLQDQMCEAQDIDRAMQNGAGYPRGPLEWTRHPISIRTVLFLLDEMLAVTGEPRYRASLALRQEFLRLNR
jgi:3-hydroxybutyryl-CoA dehydrogenase